MAKYYWFTPVMRTLSAMLLLVLFYSIGLVSCIYDPEEILLAAATKGFLIDKKLAIHGPPIGAPVLVLGGPPGFGPLPFGGPFPFGGGPIPPPFFGPGPLPPFFGPGAPFFGPPPFPI